MAVYVINEKSRALLSELVLAHIATSEAARASAAFYTAGMGDAEEGLALADALSQALLRTATIQAELVQYLILAKPD